MDLVKKARELATRAHQGQTRKTDNTPYITHPIAVAERLRRLGFSEEIQAAALVHDVVEDTKVSSEELRKELGDFVADMVAALTNDDSLSWEDKKKKYIETVRAGSEGVKAVATMDKIHNAQSLLEAHAKLGPLVWEKFNRGKQKKMWFEEEMLKMLRETWQHSLVEEYAVLVEKMKGLN